MASDKKPLFKTVKGQKLTQKEFKAEVAELVRKKVEASPFEIAEMLGEEWTEKAKLHNLAQNMDHMTKSECPYLARVGHGRYRLHPEYDAYVQNHDPDERLIQTVKSLGGICRLCDLLKAHDLGYETFKRKNGFPVSQTSEYHFIFRFLKKTTRLQRWGSGVWGLPLLQLYSCAIPGKWLEYLIVQTTTTVKTRKTGYERAHAIFKQIGETAQNLRDAHNLTIPEVLTDPVIQKEIDDLTSRLKPNLMIHTDVRATALEKAKAVGKEHDDDFCRTLYYQEQMRFSEYVLAYFENGDQHIHRAASTNFYHAYAKRFGIAAEAFAWGGTLIGSEQQAALTDDLIKEELEDALSDIGLPLNRGIGRS